MGLGAEIVIGGVGLAYVLLGVFSQRFRARERRGITIWRWPF